MHVLVTGASGFLGGHIVDKCLLQGYTVRVLVRKQSDISYLEKLKTVEIVYGDLTDKNSLHNALKNIDIVYHSAARVCDYGSQKQFYLANVIGTELILESAQILGVKRFVFISSPSIVMDMTDQININESYSIPKKFVNLYSETKALAEKSVLAANNKNFITCALRPRAIWGPRDKSGFLPRILTKIAKGKLQNISGGKQVFASICYCENAAEACVLAAQSDRVGGNAYFITDQETVNVWSFATTLAESFSLPPITKKANPTLVKFLANTCETIWKIPYLSNHYSPPISKYAVGLVTLSSTFDISAATRDFNYIPRIDQKTGLTRLKEWIEQLGGMQKFLDLVK